MIDARRRAQHHGRHGHQLGQYRLGTVAARNPQFLVLLDYQDGSGYRKLLDFLKAIGDEGNDAVKNERFVALRYED